MGVGGGVGIEGGWEAEGGLNYPLAVRKSHCVLSKAKTATVYMSGQDSHCTAKTTLLK